MSTHQRWSRVLESQPKARRQAQGFYRVQGRKKLKLNPKTQDSYTIFFLPAGVIFLYNFSEIERFYLLLREHKLHLQRAGARGLPVIKSPRSAKKSEYIVYVEPPAWKVKGILTENLSIAQCTLRGASPSFALKADVLLPGP
jgi:hypothetical protein